VLSRVERTVRVVVVVLGGQVVVCRGGVGSGIDALGQDGRMKFSTAIGHLSAITAELDRIARPRL
jgi:hypothetical protein